METGAQYPWIHSPERRLGPPPWQRLVHQLMLVVLGFIMIGVGATYIYPLVKSHQALQNEENQLAQELQQLRTLHDREETRLRWLRNDHQYLQIQARDKLDLQSPGEIIVRMAPVP